MNFEDEIRETMRAHDNEAPRADHLTIHSMRRRRRPWLPAAAALVVVAVAAGWYAVAGDTGSSDHTAVASAGGCPTSHPESRDFSNEYWVPSKPSAAGTDDRLVPDTVPSGMQLCAYLHDDGGDLTGQRAVTGNLTAARESLAWLPQQGDGQSCPYYLAMTDGDYYLIRLSYADGDVVWVAAPGNHCAGASNGVFDTSANLLDFVAPAYEQGVWTGQPQPDPHVPTGPCGGSAPGRLGEKLVPDAPTNVTICATNPPRTSTTTDIAELLARLNGLPTRPSTMSCNGGPSATSTANTGTEQTGTTYTLVFHYAEGPAVRLDLIPGCHPPIFTSSLAADGGDEIVALVEGLLG
jgi:hypothetical protein